MEPQRTQVLALAEARILACLSQGVSGHPRQGFGDLLESAYGVRAADRSGRDHRLWPGRMHNLIATATASPGGSWAGLRP